MSLPRIARLAGLTALWLVVQVPARADDDADDAFNLGTAILQEAHVGSDGPALLALFRQYNLDGRERSQVRAWITQLNDDDYRTREQATQKLMDFGVGAVPLLRQALKSPALEVCRRAKHCLKHIETPSAEVLSAAARLLAVRKPGGTIETLLQYLPMSDEEQVVSDIQATLTDLAFPDGRPEPHLIHALAGKDAVCRLTAADALCQAGGRQVQPLVVPLLHDSDSTVRLHVSLRLADFRQAEAIPVLIDLVADKTPDVASQADTYLRELSATEAVGTALGSTPASRQACGAAWQRWWRQVKPPELVQQVRQGTPDENTRTRALALIEQLGDDQFTVRERATDALIELGPVALPLLRRALKNSDVEVAHRSARCIARLGQQGKGEITAVVIRLLALHKPVGADEALLGYLPYADEGPGLDEVQDALEVLAMRDGQPAPALLRALGDSLPLRRRIAGIALARSVQGMPRPELVRLLHDPVPAVRLPIALTLLEHKQPIAVPALVGLMGVLPADQLWQADDLLRRLARDQAPAEQPGDDSKARKKRAVAWQAWYEKNRDHLDMARLEHRPQSAGRLVVVCYDGYDGVGRIWELGPDHKPRWEIKQNLRGPIDAVMIGSNRLLVAEYNGWVTERDTKGKVLWEQRVQGNPISCQRLPNGHTFVATMNNVSELTPQGKQIYSYPVAHGNITCARVLPNRHIVALGMDGTLSEMNASGKELLTFQVKGVAGNYEWRTFTLLPNGHYLIPSQSTGKIVEYDRKGKLIWTGSGPNPYSAVRLPNGHLMTVSMNTSLMAEVDRNGKTVWQEQLRGRAFKIRWR